MKNYQDKKEEKSMVGKNYGKVDAHCSLFFRCKQILLCMRLIQQKIDGNWYYYNEDGTLRTGWLKLGKYYYYLDKKDEYPGRMVANQKQQMYSFITITKQGNFFYVLLFNYKSAILPIVHEKGEIKVHEQTRI